MFEIATFKCPMSDITYTKLLLIFSLFYIIWVRYFEYLNIYGPLIFNIVVML